LRGHSVLGVAPQAQLGEGAAGEEVPLCARGPRSRRLVSRQIEKPPGLDKGLEDLN